MSIYPNVTEKDLINLRKLSDQQKNERALKIKNRILKQTHDVKLAESLSPITKKLDEVNKSAQESLEPISNKLDNINENTLRVGNIVRDTNITPSNLLKNTFKALSQTTNSLKLNKDEDENLHILGTPIRPIGGDKIIVNDNNIYEFTSEIHKALSNDNYTGKAMKDKNDRLTLYNFLTDIGYTRNKGKQTSQMKFFTGLLNQFKKQPLDGQGIQKIIIPSNIIDIYTRLEVLLGLKLSGHTDILTEASNLIDELYKRGEIQNKEQYQNAPNKFQI